MRYPSRPPVAPVPPSGTYWIRLSHRVSVYGEQENSKSTSYTDYWVVEGWVIASIDGGYLSFIGTDECSKWEDDWMSVYQVGPKIESPE